MQEPAIATWDLLISDADFEKLKAGYDSDDMDDKWLATSEAVGQNGSISVHIIRSWTKTELYRLHVKPSEGDASAKIEGITWEQNNGGIRISEEQGKKEAAFLCRRLLGCESESIPVYDVSIFWDHPAAKIGAEIKDGTKAT